MSEFSAVMEAIARTAAENAVLHGNGTTGKSYVASFWTTEETLDKELEKASNDMAMATLNGNKEAFVIAKQAYDTAAATAETKHVICWKLEEPISFLEATKKAYVDGQAKNIRPMQNVEYIWIHQDTMSMLEAADAISIEELPEEVPSKDGRLFPKVKIHLKSGIIDVKEGYKNRRGITIREDRAYIYPVSAHSMQIVGREMKRQEDRMRRYF